MGRPTKQTMTVNRAQFHAGTPSFLTDHKESMPTFHIFTLRWSSFRAAASKFKKWFKPQTARPSRPPAVAADTFNAHLPPAPAIFIWHYRRADAASASRETFLNRGRW
jgi:hypothetical protein